MAIIAVLTNEGIQRKNIDFDSIVAVSAVSERSVTEGHAPAGSRSVLFTATGPLFTRSSLRKTNQGLAGTTPLLNLLKLRNIHISNVSATPQQLGALQTENIASSQLSRITSLTDKGTEIKSIDSRSVIAVLSVSDESVKTGQAPACSKSVLFTAQGPIFTDYDLNNYTRGIAGNVSDLLKKADDANIPIYVSVREATPKQLGTRPMSVLAFA